MPHQDLIMEPQRRIGDRRRKSAKSLDAPLKQAIEDDAIAILFQPQIEPASGRVVAVEALARWEGGAGPLFDRARRAGLEKCVSRCVQDKAMRRAARWTGGLADVGLSINLLPCEFAEDAMIDNFLERIAESGLSPERLTVEIVENGLVADQKAASRRLTRLRDAGVSIAIDDFGTGYSSLAYLTTLPIDCLKIDRGLITDIVGGSRDRIVVRAMIHLAHELGLDVVVEGVESAAQLELIASWGGDLYQGFLGAEALTEEELVRFVSASLAA